MNEFAVIILVAIVGEYALSALASVLNLRALSPALPAEFGGVFEGERYARSQEYTRTRTRFGLVRGAVSLAVVLAWWQAGGFEWLDQLLRGTGLRLHRHRAALHRGARAGVDGPRPAVPASTPRS